jgi:hypothetical protein
VHHTRRHGLEEGPEPPFRRAEPGRYRLEPLPVPDMRGHITGVQQDSGDIPGVVPDRLVDVIGKPLLSPPTAIEPDPRLAAPDGLAGLQDPADHPGRALLSEFWQGLVQRPADQVPVTGQPDAGVVGKIDDQAGYG